MLSQNKLPEGYKSWTQLYMFMVGSGVSIDGSFKYHHGPETILVESDFFKAQLVKEYTELLNECKDLGKELSSLMEPAPTLDKFYTLVTGCSRYICNTDMGIRSVYIEGKLILPDRE